MPGFSVGLRGGKAIQAVNGLAAAGDAAALKFGAEQTVCRLVHRGVGGCAVRSGQRREAAAALQESGNRPGFGCSCLQSIGCIGNH